MTERIYYVGASLSLESRLRLGLEKAHSTIIYSRRWFPYKKGKFYPLVVEPPYRQDVFNNIPVLRFESLRLLERHIELRNDGATWDYDDFKSHISLECHLKQLPDYPLTLEDEYYSTWEQT